MRIYKIAGTIEHAERKIDRLEEDVRNVKKDNRDSASDIKKIRSDLDKLTKEIDSLNIGSRRFWQQQSIFTSLQRKIERLEEVEQQWKKFKEEIDDDIKKKVERSMRTVPKV